jgi:hypothetical protein
MAEKRLAGTTVLLAAGAGRCQALALALAGQGGRLLLHDAAGAEVAGAVRSRGGVCELVEVEAATVEQVERLPEQIWSRCGAVQGAVLAPNPNATARVARAGAAPFLDDRLDDWRGSLQQRIELPLFLIRALAARMAQGEGGAIVAIAGPGSPRPDCLTRVVRAALVTMTRGLAKVLPAGVRIAAFVGGAPDAQAATAAFLLAEPALPSGTIVELGDRVSRHR